jgi:hypothetical protein
MSKIKYILTIAILLAFTGIGSASNLVSNGGFESGLTGWTTSGDSTYTSAQNVFPHSGSYEAHVGAYGDSGDGYLNQTINTTAGETYVISFWYGEYNANDPLLPAVPGDSGSGGYLLPANVNQTDPANPFFQANGISVTWGSNTAFSDSGFFTSDQPRPLTGPGEGFWKSATVDVVATGAITVLSFGAFDHQQDVVLDDISVVPASAPEPATLGLGFPALLVLGLLKRRRTARC